MSLASPALAGGFFTTGKPGYSGSIPGRGMNISLHTTSPCCLTEIRIVGQADCEAPEDSPAAQVRSLRG